MPRKGRKGRVGIVSKHGKGSGGATTLYELIEHKMRILGYPMRS